MKKITNPLIVLMFILVLSACAKPIASIDEVDSIPIEIQNNLNKEARLQLFTNNQGDQYILFGSNARVNREVNEKNNHVIVSFKETEADGQQDDVYRVHAYKLNVNQSEDTTLDIYVNGELTPIDNVTSF
ncbi:hypothetical protein [Exiguobacterium sp. SL-9]|uniref:hypothetical protein n=1 Tax=Exiguobacterium sp. SL-9 TaxID=2510963 RepID=UPI00103D10AA|nr:hypothetical protein [Exiguobacterium sp. SL-9]TCI20832.1 hypothetical protein EVJ34_13355 [Exiguobacterium sp. SL-9]